LVLRIYLVLKAFVVKLVFVVHFQKEHALSDILFKVEVYFFNLIRGPPLRPQLDAFEY
jgi:hypothetical protein